MNNAKTPDEIMVMREGGKKLGIILHGLLNKTNPGTNLLDIEQSALDLIKASGGSPSFMTVDGYKWATCLCVNEVVVHGIPCDRVLLDGDIITIDVGLLYEDFHTDTAWTKLIQNSIRQPADKIQTSTEKERFLQTGEDALWKAIGKARAGNRVGDISEVIQKTIQGAGYGIVRSLVGHGVGRSLHEPPQIPGYLKGPTEDTLLLETGMTIAIEIIYAQKNPAIEYCNGDGWTIATQDKSLSSVFEHTVLITGGNPEVLTLMPGQAIGS